MPHLQLSLDASPGDVVQGLGLRYMDGVWEGEGQAAEKVEVEKFSKSPRCLKVRSNTLDECKKALVAL